MEYKKISGFSDEITEDIHKQFESLNKLGIDYFEVRGVNGKNISTLSEEELLELKALMRKHRIRVSSIGSPIGKIKLTEDFQQHFELYKNVLKIAKVLGTKYVRIFSFYHEKGTEWTKVEREEVFRRLSEMIALARSEGITLLHENEKSIYGDTAERCLDIMENLHCPNFKAVFDPANFIQCKEDTLQAYQRLKPYIEYMHIKDAMYEKGNVVPAGFGDGKLEYILKDLFASGFDGFLSIEPHLGNFKGFCDLEIGVLNEALPSEVIAEKKFTIAFESLRKILEKI